MLYFRGYWVRGRELMLVSAATVTLGLAFWPISLGAGSFFIYAAAMLGQLQLSLVILKSELATKLADRDPERAREEIRDVERLRP